jgi:hypothetical protein
MSTGLEKLKIGAIAWVLGLAALGLAACNSRPATPEESLRRFIADVTARRADAAWAGLSARSKAELKKQADALAAASKDKSDTSPAVLLFERSELLVLRPPESISVASPLGQEVTLRVSVKGGESANVKMVREGGEWKVDLVPSLEPRTAPATTPGAKAGTSTAVGADPGP